MQNVVRVHHHVMDSEARHRTHRTQTSLGRLGRLTKDEGLSAVAQNLGVVHGIADDMRVVMGGAPCFCDFS